jgi:hypothetical protein
LPDNATGDGIERGETVPQMHGPDLTAPTAGEVLVPADQLASGDTVEVPRRLLEDLLDRVERLERARSAE